LHSRFQVKALIIKLPILLFELAETLKVDEICCQGNFSSHFLFLEEKIFHEMSLLLEIQPNLRNDKLLRKNSFLRKRTHVNDVEIFLAQRFIDELIELSSN